MAIAEAAACVAMAVGAADILLSSLRLSAPGALAARRPAERHAGGDLEKFGPFVARPVAWSPAAWRRLMLERINGINSADLSCNVEISYYSRPAPWVSREK